MRCAPRGNRGWMSSPFPLTRFSESRVVFCIPAAVGGQGPRGRAGRSCAASLHRRWGAGPARGVCCVVSRVPAPRRARPCSPGSGAVSWAPCSPGLPPPVTPASGVGGLDASGCAIPVLWTSASWLLVVRSQQMPQRITRRPSLPAEGSSAPGGVPGPRPAPSPPSPLAWCCGRPRSGGASPGCRPPVPGVLERVRRGLPAPCSAGTVLSPGGVCHPAPAEPHSGGRSAAGGLPWWMCSALGLLGPSSSCSRPSTPEPPGLRDICALGFCSFFFSMICGMLVVVRISTQSVSVCTQLLLGIRSLKSHVPVILF